MHIEKAIILKMLYEGNPSIPEMSKEVNKAYATVHKYLRELVDQNLASPPRSKGAARDYDITEEGLEYLKANGLLGER